MCTGEFPFLSDTSRPDIIFVLLLLLSINSGRNAMPGSFRILSHRSLVSDRSFFCFRQECLGPAKTPRHIRSTPRGTATVCSIDSRCQTGSIPASQTPRTAKPENSQQPPPVAVQDEIPPRPSLVLVGWIFSYACTYRDSTLQYARSSAHTLLLYAAPQSSTR